MSQNEPITSVFFGVMSADLLDSDTAKQYDEGKSAAAFATSVQSALRKRYKGAEISYSIVSGISGSTPYSLRTKINGEVDHDEIPFVDDIVGKVFSGFHWVRR